MIFVDHLHKEGHDLVRAPDLEREGSVFREPCTSIFRLNTP